MAKYLGIDWGEKKMGLALSDPLGITARSFKTVKTEIKELVNIIKEEKVDRIVFGLPRNMDGSLGCQAKKVEDFVSKLKDNIDLKVFFEDETFTSKLVKSQMIKEGIHPKKNKDLIDQRSAQLILQGYLNENKE